MHLKACEYVFFICLSLRFFPFWLYSVCSLIDCALPCLYVYTYLSRKGHIVHLDSCRPHHWTWLKFQWQTFWGIATPPEVMGSCCACGRSNFLMACCIIMLFVLRCPWFILFCQEPLVSLAISNLQMVTEETGDSCCYWNPIELWLSHRPGNTFYNIFVCGIGFKYCLASCRWFQTPLWNLN